MITEKGIDLISQMRIIAIKATKNMVENIINSDMNTDAKFYHIGAIISDMVYKMDDIEEKIFEEELEAILEE